MRIYAVDAIPPYANVVPRNQAQADRIVAMHRHGLKGSEIARIIGISRERVRQLVKRETGESVRKIPTHPCRICGPAVRVANRDLSTHCATEAHRSAVAARRVARFWSRVDQSAGPGACWPWKASRYPTGYGHCGIGHVGSGGYAHRAAYTLAVGPISEGLTIDHLCRNPGCVNPAHLEAVTHRENIMRSPVAPAAINARKTHCKRGHPFSGHNLIMGRGGRARVCRACRVASTARLAARRRAQRAAA